MTSRTSPPSQQLVAPAFGAVLAGSVVFLGAVLVILVGVAPDVVQWLGWTSTEGVVGSVTPGADRAQLLYAYKVDGRFRHGDHEVPADTPLGSGSPIGVRYDPADPGDSVPAPAFEEALAFLIGMVVVSGAVALGAAVLAHRLLRRIPRSSPRPSGDAWKHTR